MDKMYTILINSDNTLLKTVTFPIMHRSSMVDGLHVLVDPTYKKSAEEFDMRTFTCLMEYRLPISETYVTEILTPSAELYQEKLEYTLPIDTRLTHEVGNVELKFTFIRLDMLEDGTIAERVRKTSSTTISVLKTEQWSDYIADAKLDPIVQMLLTTQAQNEQTKLYAQMIMATKGDSLSYDSDTNELELKAGGTTISKVTLEGGTNDGGNEGGDEGGNTPGGDDGDDTPGGNTPGGDDDGGSDSGETDNVVEF